MCETTKPDSANESTLLGLIDRCILTPRQMMLTSIGLIAFIGSIVILFALTITISLRSLIGNEPTIEFRGGTTIILKNGTPTKAQYLLPSSQVWGDTQIIVQEHDEICLQASGKIFLAAHHLNYKGKGIKNELLEPPEKITWNFTWTGPEGRDQKYNMTDNKRELLISKTSPEGSLLAYLGTETPSLTAPRPDGIIFIGNNKCITASKPNSKLWLIINDSILQDDSTSQKIFTEGLEAPNYKKHRAWENLRQRDLYDIWFKDNIGNLLVSIDIKQY